MFKKKDEMQEKAQRAKNVMDTLGLDKEAKSDIGKAIAMEILGEEFQMQDRMSKAHFLQNLDEETMQKLKTMLDSEGVMRKRLK